MNQTAMVGMLVEHERTRLIGAIAAMLRQEGIPAHAREACLTLIGWLARRMPGECASTAGVAELEAKVGDPGDR